MRCIDLECTNSVNITNIHSHVTSVSIKEWNISITQEISLLSSSSQYPPPISNHNSEIYHRRFVLFLNFNNFKFYRNLAFASGFFSSTYCCFFFFNFHLCCFFLIADQYAIIYGDIMYHLFCNLSSYRNLPIHSFIYPLF